MLNTKRYEHIFEEFKYYHPYMADDVVECQPRGEKGIRITTTDGTMYDFDIITKGIRRVKDFNINSMDDITEEWCRECIAYRLAEQMGVKGFSQQTLAEYSGLSKGTIYNYINGKATPSATALMKLARALDCSIGDLIG